MFRVIQLFVFAFVFGRIVRRTIRIQTNSLKPLFGTSLKNPSLRFSDIFSGTVGNFSTILHVYYTFLSMLDYRSLFNYLQP